jgi:hypothetical protein
MITIYNLHLVLRHCWLPITWSRDWQLSISYAKCSLMFFGCHGDKPNKVLATVHIGNHVMQCVDTFKDLAVHVDDHLKFVTQISKTVAEAQSTANLKHKLFHFYRPHDINESNHSIRSSNIRVRLQHLVALSC